MVSQDVVQLAQHEREVFRSSEYANAPNAAHMTRN